MERVKIASIPIIALMLLVVFSVPSVLADPKVLTFGWNAPLSGPAATWGILIGRAIEARSRVINESGGFTVGGQKYKWEMKWVDSAYVPSTAVTNARKMIQDGIKYMGAVGGACTAAVAPIAEAAGVITVNAAGGGAAVTKPEYKYTFRYNYDFDIVYVGFYKWLGKNRPDIKTLASINPDNETGWDGAKCIRKGAEAVGIKIVAEEFYPVALKDFYPLMTKILAKKPDMIDFGISAPGSNVLATCATGELNYKGARLQWNPNVVLQKKKAGKHNEGAYINGELPKPQTDAQKIAYNTYMKYYPADEWDSVFYEHWDLIYALTKALEKANTFDPNVVSGTLQSLKLDTAFGPTSFGGKSIYGINTTVRLPVPICQWRNGEPVYLGMSEPPLDW